MKPAKERVLCAWLAMEEYQHAWDSKTAEKLMAEGSIVVNCEGLAYCLRDGILYFTRLKMNDYDWLEHTPLHDGESMLPPDDHWTDIDPPEGFDSLLPEKVSPSIVRPRESHIMTQTVYRENGDILERIADNMEDIALALSVSALSLSAMAGVRLGEIPPRIREIVEGCQKN